MVYSSVLNTEVVPGDNAEGFLDGDVNTYVSSGLLQSDCKVSKFSGALSRNEDIIPGVQLATETATSVTLSIGRKMLKTAK